MSNLRILVTGAGIAGPTLAFWLARAGAQVTVVERAPAVRAVGQNVDVRGAGLEVIQRMGLRDIVNENTTHEDGIAFVDGDNRIKAKFGVDHSGKGESLTGETEILRGKLAVILYDATKEKVEYIFDDQVKSVDESNDKVHVTFAKSTTPRDFDLLVACDGLSSPTRALIFPDKQHSCVHSLHQNLALFSIPCEKTDGTWARWYGAPLRRFTVLRPNDATQTMVLLSIMGAEDKLLNSGKLPIAEQKAIWHDLFDDAGWEMPRVLAGLDASDDFYSSSNSQVKLDRWSKGRMSMVGDTAFCPSSISGMGTSVALVGAYVLAGELSKHGGDHETAFAEYERRMRPFIDAVQKLPPGVPGLVSPKTAWGVSVMGWVLGFVNWSRLDRAFMRFGGPRTYDFVLPEYEM